MNRHIISSHNPSRRLTPRALPERGGPVSRRSFLGGLLAVGAAPLILPGRLLGDAAPSRTLNMAYVGRFTVADRFGNFDRVRMVAVCDLDDSRLARLKERFPGARAYHDFRVMLEEMDEDIDAVAVCGPDHSHFPISIWAMAMGKHVFVEKPMANTFREAELLARAEEKFGVACQVGNQGHSGANYHQFKAFTEAGLMDGVNRVIAYQNQWRRWHPWADVTGFPEGEPVPEGVHWDLWHTVVEERPFSPRFHPGNWRGWYRYGMGALGDWGAHIIDTAHRFLELGLPTEVELVHAKRHNAYIFPEESTLRFRFAARNGRPPVDLYWYDGQENLPPIPPEFEGQDLMEASGQFRSGKFILGGKYAFFGTTHSSPLRVIPESLRREVQRDLPRFPSSEDHYMNFVLSAMGEGQCRSSFAVGTPLNQVFNIGVIAQELGRVGEPLAFDPVQKQFVDLPEANALLDGPPPREGWEYLYELA